MIAFLDLIDDEKDKERFKLLYQKYKGLMAHITAEKVDSQEDVEDVLQDAFLYIAKNFDKVGDIDSNSTKCFIAVITEGFAIKKYKYENKHIVSLADDVDIESIVSDYNFNSYDKAELKMVVDSLKDEYINLLYLTYTFGFTSKEIALMFGVSDALIRKRIQFAKLEIRNKFGGWK